MNVNKVTGYNVFTTSASAGISLLLADGERAKITSADAHYIYLMVDILRNEDPVFYNRKSGMLYTGEEPTGEGE